MDVVTDLLNYQPVEKPAWRGNESKSNKDASLGVSRMLVDIEKFQKHWEGTAREGNEIINVTENMEACFYYSVNLEEEHGVGTEEETMELLVRPRAQTLSQKQQEVVNVCDAYQYLNELLTDKKEKSLLAPAILRAAHSIILKDIDIQQRTKAGEFSNLPRKTEYKGKVYEYNQRYTDLTTEECVQLVIDRYNPLIEHAKVCQDQKEKVENTFKAAAYLVFEMLDVHPFSDGNGRLCRLLASYVLDSMSPFPTPIYNVWSKSHKGDYVQALVETRMSDNRHPCALTSMMIECNWFEWRKFYEKLKIPLPI